MKVFFFAFCLLCSINTAFGQVKKTIHQTFDMGETTTITLALAGEYTVVPWASNTVMTETHVELYDASPSILKHLLEKDQRYRIDADTTGGTMKLVSFDQKREPVRTRSGTCTEIVHVKVYVPDTFKGQGETTFIKTK